MAPSRLGLLHRHRAFSPSRTFEAVQLDAPVDVATSDGWHPDLDEIADFCRRGERASATPLDVLLSMQWIAAVKETVQPA